MIMNSKKRSGINTVSIKDGSTELDCTGVNNLNLFPVTTKLESFHVWECCCVGFRHSHCQGVKVILQRFPTGLRLLKFLVGAHEKVVLGVQCLLGEGRAVQVLLRAVAREK